MTAAFFFCGLMEAQEGLKDGTDMGAAGGLNGKLGWPGGKVGKQTLGAGVDFDYQPKRQRAGSF